MKTESIIELIKLKIKCLCEERNDMLDNPKISDREIADINLEMLTLQDTLNEIVETIQMNKRRKNRNITIAERLPDGRIIDRLTNTVVGVPYDE